MRIENPYESDGFQWYRGNLHAHTTQSDGRRSPQELLDSYASLGYDFLMLSDHDMLTDTSELRAHGMTLIPGNEVTINGPHLLHIDAKSVVPPDPDRQVVIDQIVAERGMAVMAHPNWEAHFNHCPQESLDAWDGYIGVEIYNGLVRRHPGNPLATDRWDRLLGLGRRLWAFANDDSHAPEDEGLAWNVVECQTLDTASVLDALRAGRFYASTGVTIESIQVRDNVIQIATRDAERIVANVDFGRRIAHVDANKMALTVDDAWTYRYVRFECHGPGESMAWTQPFFLERPESAS